MKTMKHRGYLGSIEADLDDGVLHGQVMHINGLITYSGKTIAELENAFENVVDHYLTRCKRLNIEPSNPTATS